VFQMGTVWHQRPVSMLREEAEKRHTQKGSGAPRKVCRKAAHPPRFEKGAPWCKPAYERNANECYR